MEKTKTSVYLHPEIYARAKKKAEERGISYSDWVTDAITAVLANPEILNSIRPKLEAQEAWEKVQKFLKLKHKTEQEEREDLELWKKRIEAKINLLMNKLEIKPLVKDESGRRVFDE